MRKMLLKRLIFLIVFIELALGVTYYFIMKNLPVTAETDEISIEDDEKTEEINVKTVSLDETYNLNDLKISEYDVTIENVNYETNYDDNGVASKGEISDVTYSYFQIDGLKDESVEISINYLLKNDLETAINDVLNSDDFSSSLYVSADTYENHANFANVISLKYSIDYVSTLGNYETIYICENFDLTTGNRLKLNDVILNTANMRQILSEKLYNCVISSSSDLFLVNDETALEYRITDYNDVEETILELINKFQNEKNINFTFNEYQLSFPEYNCNILYKNCLDYVIIYDKFNDDYIYDGTYSNLENLPVLTKVDNFSNYVTFEEGENYFIYVSLNSDIDENILAGEKSPVANFVDEKVQEIKSLASENPDIFYIFNASYITYPTSIYNEITYTYDFDYTLYNLYEYSYQLETTKNRYDTILKDEILEILRDYPEEEMGDVYLYGGLFADYMYGENFDYTINDYLYNVLTTDIYLENTNLEPEEDEETYTIWDTSD